MSTASRRRTFVADVVMKQKITPFLQAAIDKGCQIQVGKDMLFEQIPAYLEFFGFGTTTPDELTRGLSDSRMSMAPVWRWVLAMGGSVLMLFAGLVVVCAGDSEYAAVAWFIVVSARSSLVINLVMRRRVLSR